MNTIRKVASSVHRWMLILAGTVVVFSMALAIPTGTTLAVAVVQPTPTPGSSGSSPVPRSTPTPVPDKGNGGTTLSAAFKHEQQVLATQQSNLVNAAGSVSKIQDLISKASAKGIDTSALSSALATFQSELGTANASHATAAGILSSANGFDANGKVTALAAAKQTVDDARQNLQDAHKTLSQAVGDLHTAVKSWEENTKDTFQDQHLQQDYKNEQTWLTTQQGNLAKTNDAVTRVQDLISKAQAKGLDTTVLSTALSTFQAEIATATGSNTTAAGILSSHAGFDASGNVTDQGAAQQTVKDAHQSLSDGHNTLVQAVTDLQTAVKQWLAANQPGTTPAGTVNNG